MCKYLCVNKMFLPSLLSMEMLFQIKYLVHTRVAESGAGVIKSWRFVGGVRFLTTLGVGVGFFCPTPTPNAQLDHFLHHTPKL